MSVTVPGRSRSASLVPLVKGRAWRHRLLRAPGMSHWVASRPNLKLSGMLDEPTARYPPPGEAASSASCT